MKLWLWYNAFCNHKILELFMLSNENKIFIRRLRQYPSLKLTFAEQGGENLTENKKANPKRFLCVGFNQVCRVLGMRIRAKKVKEKSFLLTPKNAHIEKKPSWRLVASQKFAIAIQSLQSVERVYWRPLAPRRCRGVPKSASGWFWIFSSCSLVRWLPIPDPGRNSSLVARGFRQLWGQASWQMSHPNR